MPNPSSLDQDHIAGPDSPTSDESFGDILSQYEQSHTHKPETGEKGLEGTVISVTAESVFVDIGYKIEGVIPLAEFVKAGEPVKPGDKLPVSIKGRGEDGYAVTKGTPPKFADTQIVPPNKPPLIEPKIPHRADN